METRDGRTLMTVGFVSIAILFLIYARFGDSEITPAAVTSIERLGITFYVMMTLAFGAISFGLYQYNKQKVQKAESDVM